MRSIKIFSVLLLLMIIASSALAYFFWYKPKFRVNVDHNNFSVKSPANRKATFERLRQKAALASDFARSNELNTTHCFLLDMKLPSGRPRFFVYNLQHDSIELAGLVTHGSGSGEGGEELIFSNTPNSNCTSLGRYRIGNAYQGKFGLAYKLFGLDATNSNAFKRFVVLHAHSCVPNGEVYPLPICESWGCPTVSPSFLSALKNYIDRSPKPLLLWIYY